MRLVVLRGNLALYWKRRLVRAGAVILISAAVVFTQYRLAHIPRPIQIESSDVKVPPIRFGEELVITLNDLKSKVLFAHRGDTKETVNVSLERATINKETRRKHPTADFGSATAPDFIAYTTGDPGSSKVPCATDVDAQLENEQQPVSELVFLQSAGPGNENYRLIDIKADQSVLLGVVTNPLTPGEPQLDPDAVDDGPGCVKNLDGKAFAGKGKTYAGAFVVKSDVPAKSRITLRFSPSDARNPIWSGHDQPWEPFLTASPIFVASKIAIRSSSGNTIPFEITASNKAAPLWVNTLKIGSDHLEVGIVGKGLVTIDGEVIPLEFFKLIQQNPFIASLFAMVNTGLLVWLAGLVRGLLKAKAD